MFNKTCFLLAFIFLAFSTPTWALGKIGHQLVCQLSYDLLSEAKQQKLDALLANIPIQHRKKINRYNFEKTSKPLSFANSCTFPDAFKNQPAFKKFKSWHYINVNRDSVTLSSESCFKNCITQAIPFHREKLTVDSPQEKLIALMFLGHWLGDIHQPLHVSFASDWGGNKNKVTPLVGKCNNLHWYWDECLLYPINKAENAKKGFDFKAFKLQLYHQLTDKLKSAPIKQWQHSSVIHWANESIALVRENNFRYCTIKNNTCYSNSDKQIKLTKQYHQHYQKVLYERILQAAVRLAYILEQDL